MFSSAHRQDVANRLIAAAERAPAITAGAVVGPAAVGALDAANGIDLLFAASSSDTADAKNVLAQTLYNDFDAVHHVVEQRSTTYLLPQLLTARIAVVAADIFGPQADEPFWQVFGPPPQQLSADGPAPADPVGVAWYSALGVRAALRRGHSEPARVELERLRGVLVVLIAARTGAPAGQLPLADRDRIAQTVPSSSGLAAISRAFAAAVPILDAELQAVAPAVADAVTLPLLEEVAN